MARALAILLLLCGLASTATAEPSSEVPSRAQLQVWLHDLDAEDYATRDSAMRQLVAAGPIAIDVLSQGVASDSPEAAWRASEALQQIALEGDEAALAGVAAALEQVQRRGKPGVMSIVRDLRSRQARLRHDRAAGKLRSLGAKLSGGEGQAHLAHFGGFGFGGGFIAVDIGGDLAIDAFPVLVAGELAAVDGGVIGEEPELADAPDKPLPLKALETTLERLASLIVGGNEPAEADAAEAAEIAPPAEGSAELPPADVLPVDAIPSAIVPIATLPAEDVGPEIVEREPAIAAQEEEPPADPEPPALEAPLEEPIDGFEGIAEAAFIGEAFVGEAVLIGADFEGEDESASESLVLDRDWRGGDAALAALRDLPGIGRLAIREAKLSDASLAHVATLPKLQQLDIQGGSFSAEALFKLRAARRELLVLARGPAALGILADVKGPCVLTTICAGSGAEQAGLKTGDQIVAVDGQSIEDFSDLTIAVYARAPGDKLSVEVLREQKRQAIDVVLTDRSVLE